MCAWTNFDFLASSSEKNETTVNQIQNTNQISEKKKKKKEDWGWEKKKVDLPVRPRENLVITVPVTANPTRKGQFRFHSRLKKTDQGSNRRIFFFTSLSLPFTLRSSTPTCNTCYSLPLLPRPQTKRAFLGPTQNYTNFWGLRRCCEKKSYYYLQQRRRLFLPALP